MNVGKPIAKLPNYSRRVMWACVVQVLLVFALFTWSNLFPAWLNRVIVISVIPFPLLAYLTAFTQPSIRRAWLNMLRESRTGIVYVIRAVSRLIHPATVVKIARYVASLRPMPVTVDEWITLCVLPFKTCIVATFPLIWAFEKVLSHTAYFRPYGRTFGLSYESVFECYLVSLLGLLLGALVQRVFCQAGRATKTLRFFLLGLILIFLTGLGLMAH